MTGKAGSGKNKKGGHGGPPFSTSQQNDLGVANHIHECFAAAAVLEFDFAIDFGENGVVAADADIFAWVKFGAALADDDTAR